MDHAAVKPASSSRPHAAAPAGAQAVPLAAPGTAALAMLTGAGKNRKVPAGTAVSTALVKTPSKGAGSFLDLLKAKAATKSGPRDPAVSLKVHGAKPSAETPNALPVVQAAHPGATGRAPASTETATAGGAADAAAGAAAKEEKAASKKKVPPVQAVTTAALAVMALASTDGGKTSAPREKAAAAASPDLKSASAVTRAAVQPRDPVIHIVDLRTPGKHPSVDPVAASTAQPQGADKDFSAVVIARSAPSRDTAPAPAADTPAASPQQSPLDRLQEMAGTELLRASTLVLKDGGGEIRLVLKPESLGSVRIRMNLVDNAIEGRIVVDSSSVKQVVDANMDALRRALTAQGFQPGSLQVSVGGQGTDADARRQDQPAPEVRRVTSQAFDQSVPAADALSLGDMLVNLFV